MGKEGEKRKQGHCIDQEDNFVCAAFSYQIQYGFIIIMPARGVWLLLHKRAANTHARLCTGAVLSEPSLLTYTKWK